METGFSSTSTRHRIFQLSGFSRRASLNFPLIEDFLFFRGNAKQLALCLIAGISSRFPTVSEEIQPRRTVIRYVGQFTVEQITRIRGRLLRILSRSVNSFDSLPLSFRSTYPLARALASKIDRGSISDLRMMGKEFCEKWLEPRFYASVLVVNVPSMSRSPTSFTESRFTECYITATHLSFEVARSPRIHHASLTLFSSRYLALSQITPSSFVHNS